MSTSPREIGTLIVVLLKARNLPNKRHIGKQDPYCVVEFNDRKVRTKVIKRGGQHPEWDEEIRFTLYEADDDAVTASSNSGLPPPPPKKPSKDVINVQGGKHLKLACYAQDVKEPDLIGETRVDLTEVLTKGETDEWFTLTNKERYSGEVYLELTFWSNEPAPVKKAPLKAKAKKQYGGPGTFTALADAHGSSESLNGSPSRWSPSGVRALSTTPSGTWRHSSVDTDIKPAALPQSLRSSSSIAQIGLYRPQYESTGTHSSSQSSLSFQQSTSSVAALTDEMGQMSLGLRRRLSLPQMTHTELVRQSTTSSSSSYLQVSPANYNHTGYSSYSDDGHTYRQDGSESQAGLGHVAQHHTGGSNLYQPPYEPISRTSSVYSTNPQQPSRGPRHSLPSSSSGFVPLPTTAPSTFGPPTQQTPSYQPPVSATPAPPMYGRMSVPPPSAPPTHTQFPGYTSVPPVSRPPTTAPTPAQYPSHISHTPAPPSNFSVMPQHQPGPATQLSQAVSYQSMPQPQSSYSYQSFPSSSSISSNSVHQYSQSPTPPSTTATSPNPQYSTAYNPLPSMPQHQDHSRPPPSQPGLVHPPSISGYPHQHSLPQVPPPPPPTQTQSYSAPVSNMSGSPSYMSVNIPPPPPLNSSPSQNHSSRPLPEVPPGGPSPVKRQPAMSMALSLAVTSVPPRPQPSVSYPTYSQIPPPPPIQNGSNMSPVRPGAQVSPPPPVPNSRRLSQPPLPQTQSIPGPPPLHQAPQSSASAQALYHSAMARQAGGNPLPPPPPSVAGHRQPQLQHQSAYQALQQQPAHHSFAPPQPPNYQAQSAVTYPGLPTVGHPGALPIPPRMPPSQPHQQYPVANGWQ